MGRILRRKKPGVAARFVIMFAKDTLEDPANRVERDGYLHEIERISDSTGVFDGTQFKALEAFLAAPGPNVVPEPALLEHYERATQAIETSLGPDQLAETLADLIGVEAAYAFLSFAAPDAWQQPRKAALLLGLRLPRPDPDTSPYVELELTNLPDVAKPRVKAKRLSSGHAPLEIARVSSGRRISCTGCGEASPLVQFRWELFDQTIVCRCD
jgi:hypothetical protein